MNHPTLDSLIAHSDHGDGPQSLRAHLEGVARRVQAFADAFDSSAVGNWLGWWHDAGKVAPDVQAYLHGETDAKRGPDHSSAGMLEAWDVVPYLANIIAGHHSGLDDPSCLRQRVTKKQSESRVTEARTLAADLLATVVSAPSPHDTPAFLRKGTKKEQHRRLAFWQRMLHSALVDADRLDAEAHGSAETALLREAESPALDALKEKLDHAQEALIAEAPRTPLNRIRADLYRACLDKAPSPAGFFSLTVPTGGGKTRTALAFALHHAFHQAQRRVIVALPYTSIIEQNADVYRGLLGAEAVLEHHSTVHQREPHPSEDFDDETERKTTLAADNWDAPLVVTTNVQFFESLFACNNSRLRKLHRIPRSVIVLDEVQTLPPELLVPTLEALRFLVEDYGCTVVFCTATQPAFRHAYGDPYTAYFPGFDLTELVPDPDAIYKALRRVHYEVHTAHTWTWPEVAAEMRTTPQALAIVNTVKDAQALFTALDRPQAFHLSTRLCPAHRRNVLAEVRRRLDAGEPVYLVSTQVVEAGVDISFPLVLRAFGPLDSLIQAAGRCNREGLMAEPGRVVIFKPTEGGMPPGAYYAGAEQTRTLLRKYGEDFAEKLHAPDLPLEYFRQLYPTQNLDAREIQAQEIASKFRETARRFRFIEETVGVVVPYKPERDHKATRLRDRTLRRIQANGFATRRDWRDLQPFTVNLREKDHARAVEDGLCMEVVPGIWQWLGQYDSALQGCGLAWQADANALIC